jgi:hypothetical protein
MTKLESKNVLRSADRVTSPVSVTRDGKNLVLALSMSPKACDKLQDLADASGESLDDVISKAFVLYIEAADANRHGKSVGIASTADVLETQFVGF